MRLVAVLLMTVLAAAGPMPAQADRDRIHPPPDPPRDQGHGFGIIYDRDEREVHVYGSTNFDLTQGTAIIVYGGFQSGPPIVRVNLVTDNGEGGPFAVSKDYPLYSEMIAGPGGGGGEKVLLVEEIHYHGTDGRDEFSNYTDIPLWAFGGEGDDFFLGGGGPDELLGGDDDDVIRGGDSADEISGWDGNDDLKGEGGDDEIRGHGGDDVIDGGSGDDTIEPGQGSDIAYGRDGDDTIIESPAINPQTNILCGHDGADYLKGASGAGAINQLDGELGEGDGDVDTLLGYGSGSESADQYDYDELDPVENEIFLDGNQIFQSSNELPAPTMVMCNA